MTKNLVAQICQYYSVIPQKYLENTIGLIIATIGIEHQLYVPGFFEVSENHIVLLLFIYYFLDSLCYYYYLLIFCFFHSFLNSIVDGKPILFLGNLCEKNIA